MCRPDRILNKNVRNAMHNWWLLTCLCSLLCKLDDCFPSWNMSLNWVTRQDNLHQPFVPLPGEILQHTQAEPVIVELVPVNQPKPEKIVVKGTLFLTSHRVVLLSQDQKEFSQYDNFSLAYKDVVSHKLDMPWFGSNKYKLLFRISNANGGLNYLYQWQMSIVFSSGGAMAFTKRFSELKTRSDNDQADELPAYSA